MALPYTTSSVPGVDDGSMFAEISRRYLTIPEVHSFVFDSRPAPPCPSLVPRSFSYACLYQFQPGGSSKRGRKGVAPKRHISSDGRNQNNPPFLADVPYPVLEQGNLMFQAGEYDGIAVGYLFSQNDLQAQYSLAQARDAIGPTGLSYGVRCRKFATDLRREQGFEYVEFGWMNDGSLILTCRRLVPGLGIGGLALNAEILFYDKPEIDVKWNPVFGDGLRVGKLLRMMSIREKTQKYCTSCTARGLSSCICGSFSQQSGSNGFLESYNTSPYAMNGENRLVDCTANEGPGAQFQSWSNFVQRVHSLSLSGSFYVRWWKAGSPVGGGSNNLKFFVAVPKPVSYIFRCGTTHETSSLVSVYLCELERYSQIYCSDARYITPSLEYPRESNDTEMFEGGKEDSLTELDLLLKGSDYNTQNTSGKDHMLKYEGSPVSSAHSSPQMDEMIVLEDSSHAEPRSAADSASELVRAFGLDAAKMTDTEYAGSSSLSSVEHIGSSPHSVTGIQDTSPYCDAQQEFILSPRRGRGHTVQYDGYTISFSADGSPICPLCGKVLKKLGNVKRHIKTVHEEKREYTCNICGKAFGHKTHRDRHLGTHNPDLPFSCQKCEGRYRTAELLEKHVATVHRNTNITAEQQSKLTCSLCGVAFAQKSNLNRHIATKHERRRHPCPYCTQTFGQQFDMKRHVRKQHKEVVQ